MLWIWCSYSLAKANHSGFNISNWSVLLNLVTINKIPAIFILAINRTITSTTYMCTLKHVKLTNPLWNTCTCTAIHSRICTLMKLLCSYHKELIHYRIPCTFCKHLYSPRGDNNIQTSLTLHYTHMHMRTHMCVHTDAHTCVHTNAHTCVHTDAHIYARMYTHIYTHSHTYARTSTQTHTHTFTHDTGYM